MEKLIRDNFMAEWQIEEEINWTRGSLKQFKSEFKINISDEEIDDICDHILDGINVRFYKIRNNI